MNNIFNDGTPIPVIAYNFETKEKIGEFCSMAKASRKCFIRNEQAIHSQIFLNKYKNGIKGYKNPEIRYTFTQIKKDGN